MNFIPSFRAARKSDLTALSELEQRCFSSDQLSRRSFSHFIQSTQANLSVMEQTEAGQTRILGYLLLLFRRGTNLARLYSIAIDPDFRGRGLAKLMMIEAEAQARLREAAFLRLEVRIDNKIAVELYRKAGYHPIAKLPGYYEDGGEGVRLEKSIRRQRTSNAPVTRYYQQTTPFTCGPASLLMALQRFDANYTGNAQEELRIWRESTTIYMTSGHGGCSPQGLALSAVARGLKVELYSDPPGVPFIEGVRDPGKKRVIEIVHEDYKSRLPDAGVKEHNQLLGPEDLVTAVQQGHLAICLISTWRLNRNRAPHWVLISGADSGHLYICDPDYEYEPWHTELDYLDVPITPTEFSLMARYGRNRLHATLLLSP